MLCLCTVHGAVSWVSNLHLSLGWVTFFTQVLLRNWRIKPCSSAHSNTIVRTEAG